MYIGQTVLDLSKLRMYKFWYGYLKRKYANQCQLLCTDTDSFLSQVQTTDIYESMKRDAVYFDFSDYPKDHRLFSLVNKKSARKIQR